MSRAGEEHAKAARSSDRALREPLLTGDEHAFEQFVVAHHASLARFSRMMSGSCDAAILQRAWEDFLGALPSSDPESSLRSVLFRCLAARRRELAPIDLSPGDEERAVDAARFLPAEHRWGGGWALPPQRFATDDPVRAAELREVLRDAIGALPLALRAVIVLRDMEGFDADEVCAILSISIAEQRTLLHRARSRARAAVEARLQSSAGGTS